MSFISFSFVDALDILLTAFLLYQFYQLIRGTVAINIFVVVFITYLIWMVVKALNMELLSNILGQIMGVGIIALIIVFQQEIRRFLVVMGRRYFNTRSLSLERLFSFFIKEKEASVKIYPIVKACLNMSKSRTGALLVISDQSTLETYAESGEIVDANLSSRLLENIFYKNTPLHDGAVIIQGDKIHAAGCILPVSSNKELPKHLGLRHRAALGISELTDAFVVVVSEENGNISYAQFGVMHIDVGSSDLRRALEHEFTEIENLQKAKTPGLAMKTL